MSALIDIVAEIARPRATIARESVSADGPGHVGDVRRPYSGRWLWEDDAFDADVPYWIATAAEVEAGCAQVVAAPESEWTFIRISDALAADLAEAIRIDLVSRGVL